MFFSALGAATLICMLAVPGAFAAPPAYSTKPIHLAVAQTAGGNADFGARYVAQHLIAHLGQQIVTDNHAGGSGIVGTELVVHGPRDDYKLLLAATLHAINPNFVAKRR